MKTSEHHRQHGEHAGEVRQQLGGDRGPENQRTAGGEEEDGQTALLAARIGKKILLHSKTVGRQGRRLSEQKPRRVQPETQGTRTGSHAVRGWSEDLVESLKG